MATKRAFDDIFLEGAIHTVAEIGIENTRTKHIADYSGFSVACMYQLFPSKIILLKSAFLSVDSRITDILRQCSRIRRRSMEGFEQEFSAVWKKLYRYLLDHREETIFLIRYRFSSLYTEEVRAMSQMNNGGLEKAYKALEPYCGPGNGRFLLNNIFELTLLFAERIINGCAKDDAATEDACWKAVSSLLKTFTQGPSGIQSA